jgi:hypothetical protein
VSRDVGPSDLGRLVTGGQLAQAISVAAMLGIADLLAGGPRTSDDLAKATETHPGALYRLLRALASAEVLAEEDGRLFALTALGEGLRSDAPEPLGAWAAYLGQPYYLQAWMNLVHSVRTGESAFPAVHGMGAWEYRNEHPEEGEYFDRAMTDLSRSANRGVLEAHDFARYGTIVDVGGGHGALLAAVLARHPGVQGVLFDQPQVLAGAAPILEEAGVADRCRIAGGSFFDAIPDGGDAYMLKSILHDWDDAEATAILRNCRRAMPEGGSLLVIERDLGPANEGLNAKLSDLNMLVMLGGRERTVDEYSALFEAAGFRLVEAVPTKGWLRVLEATPVPLAADG